jgi:hypothetical protein
MALELRETDEGRLLVVEASGKLTREDYERFVPTLDRLIQHSAHVCILFHLHDFHGWNAAAMWEDTKFAFKHFNDIARLAVVGEKTWQKGLTIFCKKARAWLHEEHMAKCG